MSYLERGSLKRNEPIPDKTKKNNSYSRDTPSSLLYAALGFWLIADEFEIKK